MADTAQNMLNAERITDLLKLGYLLAKFPNGNRDTSQAYNVMERIYRIVDGDRNKLEEMPWYRCSWCLDIANVVVSGGTTKLLRHIKKCDARPKNYVLPEHNLHVQGRAVHVNVAGPSRIEPHENNAAKANPGSKDLTADGVSNADQILNSSSQSSQQMDQNRTLPVDKSSTSAPNEHALNLSNQNERYPVSDDQMAEIIARLSEIFVLYGNVGAHDIRNLLPLQSNQAYLRQFYQKVQRIASKKSGINSPRCALSKHSQNQASGSNADNLEVSAMEVENESMNQSEGNDGQILNLAKKGRNPNAAHATRAMDADLPKAKAKKVPKQRKIVSKTPRIPREASVKAKEGIKSTYCTERKNKKK